MSENACQNRRETIAALVIGELDIQAGDELKKHIDTCSTCRSLYSDLAVEEEVLSFAFDQIKHSGKSIEQGLIERLDKHPSQPSPRKVWIDSVIIKRIAKIAAAAAVVVIVLSFVTPIGQEDESGPISTFSLLGRASAAERAFFISENIAHIVNEIIVYPAAKDRPTSTKLDEWNLTPRYREYLETVNSWLDFNWLDLCSLGADGQFRFNQLKLSENIDRSYTITDQAWYEPATGCFARIMQMDEKIIFANSYDGEFIYFSEAAADGSLRLLSERVTADFTAPQNPADFLGISAGLRSSIKEDDFPTVQKIAEETLNDGSTVYIYKQGFADLLGEINTYWLFKVRADNDTIAEMEFVLAGSTQLIIRRVLSESIESPRFSWNLAEIDSQIRQTQQSPEVAVKSDAVIPNVSVQHMIENAGFETYIFAVTPPWTNERVIVDSDDYASPGERMFFITYDANDGRHIILGQSHTFNNFFTSVLEPFLKGTQPLYTSPNGFKLWPGGPDKWWTELHIRGAGFTPADDRSGYVLQSPAGTCPSLAINGQLTDEELVNLVDSLVPAKKALELSSEELRSLIENLPSGKIERQYDPLTDPDKGMPADGLAKEQAMMKIAAEYYNAIIDKDWDHVAKLRPLYGAGFWKDKYSTKPVTELIEVKQPYKPKLPCPDLLVPCIIKREGKTIETTVVVMYRVIDGRASCVIPALWGKPRIIE